MIRPLIGWACGAVVCIAIVVATSPPDVIGGTLGIVCGAAGLMAGAATERP